jgi:hypothetical protein
MKRANRLAWAVGSLLLAAALAASGSQSRKLYPVDEAPKDPSFLAFRQQLIGAAKRRDQRFLLSHLDPHIVVNPFTDPLIGVKWFKEEWHPEDPKSELWVELLDVLSLGGSFRRSEALADGRVPTGRQFVAPYVASRWPDRFAVEHYSAIIGKHIPVRAQPKAAAPVVDVVSYEIVKAEEEQLAQSNRWVKITTPRGKRGYVAADQIRNAQDTEAHFAKRHGRWMLIALFASWGE